MLPVLSILFLIFKVIIAFSLLIMIHELGHFIVAKKSGVWVEEFGLGLPPRIIGKKVGDTIYSLNWLPIGGFVRLHGETSSDQVVYPDKAFTNKKPLVKIAITIAGIVMNFVLAIVCFSILFAIQGIPEKIPNPEKINIIILGVNPNSPAEKAGITTDDVIDKINGKKITDDTNFKQVIESKKGQTVSLELSRNNSKRTVEVIPRTNPPAGEGALGIGFSNVYFPQLWQRPFISVWYGAKQTFDLSKAVVLGLGNAAHSVSQGQSPEGLSGPVGIIAIAKRIAELGILALVNLVAVISVNLAIVNLIPFPPLDGSRIALIIAEKLTKKKMTPKLEERVYLVGFAVLIGIMILVTSHEIPALIKAGGFDKYADTLLSPK